MARDDEDWDDDDFPLREGGAYAVVHTLTDRPVVACTIFGKRDAPIAHRQWVLEPDGIHIHCACGKDGKPVKVKANPDGTTEIVEPFHDECSETIAPEPIDTIHRQLTQEIEAFADDWGTRPIRFYAKDGAKEKPTRRLKLAGLWTDEDALDYAASTWYIMEGERLLDEIEKSSGDLEAIRAKWDVPAAKAETSTGRARGTSGSSSAESPN